MKTRLVALFCCVLLAWGLLIARATYIQILPNQRLSQLESKLFNTRVELQPRRGLILDRNGNELAVSVPMQSLFADPHVIKNSKKVAYQLAKILKIKPHKILNKLKDTKKRFVWIERRLDSNVTEKIKSLDIHGLGFVEESKRVYPNNELLAHTIGFVGAEGQGLDGLEAGFDSELRGHSKKVLMQKDAYGRPLLVNGQIFTEAPEGADIVLTIDTEFQYILEQELHTQQKKQNAAAAVGVILDVDSSEILALAGFPSFDPNRFYRSTADARRNRTITDPIEPGSTMKAFTIAASLKYGKSTENKRYNTENGRFKIGKRTIREADRKHEFESLTVKEILAHSSNIGSAKIALELGQEKLLKVFRELGFGEKTGVELMGESRGIMPSGKLSDHLIANISFGHGIAATPLQIANAYAAIVNGGELNRPHIIKRIHHREEGEVEDFEKTTLRRVITPEQSDSMRQMLINAVHNGTGAKAQVNGFYVGGKTGTSQKLNSDGSYASGSYISSFAGFIPGDKPKYIIYIAFDDPKESYYGSDVAAPVFAKVASQIVRKAGLAPTLLAMDPDIKNKKVSKPQERSSASLSVDDPTKTIVPKLEGMSLREVIRSLRAHDLEFEIKGRGHVVNYRPEKGSVVSKGTRVTITLSQ